MDNDDLNHAAIAPILAEIGQLIYDRYDEQPDEIYLYAEAEAGYQEAGVFGDVGDKVIYRSPGQAVFLAIAKLWKAAPADKKWFLFGFSLKGSHFTANYVYPEQLTEGKDGFELRREALKDRFGDKPIDYSDPMYEE